MRNRIADSCVCCGETELRSSPAVLMPFLSHRIFNHAPFEITDDHDLKRYGINNGTAYEICNSLSCTNCQHLFLDIRFNDSEMTLLYEKYREEEYVNLRDFYEPGYKIKNEELNLGYNYVKKIEDFLFKHTNLENSFNILDWGGDTGKNTPFYEECQLLHIYDISDRPCLEKAIKVKKDDMEKTEYDVVVCSNVLEHVPFPRDVLCDMKTFMNKHTILYVELPYENFIRVYDTENNLENAYKNKRHWHEHINFFNEKSIKEMLISSGFEVIELRKLNISGETADFVFQVCCKMIIKEIVLN